MPSFTDASLVAAGAGALLVDHAGHRGEHPAADRGRAVRLRRPRGGRLHPLHRRRHGRRWPPSPSSCFHRRAKVAARSLRWWFGSLAAFAALVLAFDATFYGGPLKTGYGAGEITFSLSAVVPNLQAHAVAPGRGHPRPVLGLAALGWMAVRLVLSTGTADPQVADGRPRATRRWAPCSPWGGSVCGRSTPPTPGRPRWAPADRRVGGGGGAIHIIRFYLPAIGLIALLGAWLLAQLPRWLPPLLLVAVAGLGLWSFESLTAVGALGGARGWPPRGLRPVASGGSGRGRARPPRGRPRRRTSRRGRGSGSRAARRREPRTHGGGPVVGQRRARD